VENSTFLRYKFYSLTSLYLAAQVPRHFDLTMNSLRNCISHWSLCSFIADIVYSANKHHGYCSACLQLQIIFLTAVYVYFTWTSLNVYHIVFQ